MGVSLLLEQNRQLNERTSRYLAGTLRDHKKVAIPAGSLTTLTLTLYNLSDLAIINSRNDTNVLNANGGTVDANGLFEFTLKPLDTQIVGATAVGAFETHLLLLEWTFNAGADAGNYELEHFVKNLNKVP